MTNSEENLPQPQKLYKDATHENATAYKLMLERTFEGLHLKFDQVSSVVDLYCGNGILTLASLQAFPNAHIHSVDYHNVLVPDAVRDPRVTFHQGMVTDILAASKVPRADLVIMSFASFTHGFNEKNISLLSSHVGKYLLTVGDNARIEETSWFKKTFRLRAYETVWDGHVWSVK